MQKSETHTEKSNVFFKPRSEAVNEASTPVTLAQKRTPGVMSEKQKPVILLGNGNAVQRGGAVSRVLQIPKDDNSGAKSPSPQLITLSRKSVILGKNDEAVSSTFNFKPTPTTTKPTPTATKPTPTTTKPTPTATKPATTTTNPKTVVKVQSTFTERGGEKRTLLHLTPKPSQPIQITPDAEPMVEVKVEPDFPIKQEIEDQEEEVDTKPDLEQLQQQQHLQVQLEQQQRLQIQQKQKQLQLHQQQLKTHQMKQQLKEQQQQQSSPKKQIPALLPISNKDSSTVGDPVEEDTPTSSTVINAKVGMQVQDRIEANLPYEIEPPPSKLYVTNQRFIQYIPLCARPQIDDTTSKLVVLTTINSSNNPMKTTSNKKLTFNHLMTTSSSRRQQQHLTARRNDARIQQQQLQEQQQHGENEKHGEEQEDDPLRMDDEESVFIGQNGEQYEDEEGGLDHEEGLQVNDDDWEEVQYEAEEEGGEDQEGEAYSLLCRLCQRSISAVQATVHYRHCHQLDTNINNEYVCPYCPHSFSVSYLVEAHVESTHYNCKEKCPICGVRFMKLKSHIERVHTMKNVNKCKLCGKVVKHLSSHHCPLKGGEVKNKLVDCPACGNQVKEKYLRIHRRSHCVGSRSSTFSNFRTEGKIKRGENPAEIEPSSPPPPVKDFTNEQEESRLPLQLDSQVLKADIKKKAIVQIRKLKGREMDKDTLDAEDVDRHLPSGGGFKEKLCKVKSKGVVLNPR